MRGQKRTSPGPAFLAMTTWMIDKSALVRLAASPDAAEWAGRIERGLVRLTTDRGQHRAPSIPDLIIAATAERAGLTVLPDQTEAGGRKNGWWPGHLQGHSC